jgi:pimeloyl-ACP methyl ester carboxylesterase
MEQPLPDWPATRWSLTAPEAYVLNTLATGAAVADGCCPAEATPGGGGRAAGVGRLAWVASRRDEGFVGRMSMAMGVAVAALGLAFAAGPAEAALRFRACGSGGFRCARLAVPLDRSGAVPGEVSLLVERHRARRARRAPVVVLAGGPGESATAAAPAYRLLLGRAARSRDVIVFDQRGTGRSGLLRCRPLERTGPRGLGTTVADCARRLGARSALYTTRDSVADIEAVRQALGARRIALFGISYGTKVALAYALAHPQQVERLALDSVVEPDGPSALDLQSFEATPRVLSALCRGGACRRISRDPVRDLERLVARLAEGPLRGSVIGPRGKRRSASLSRRDLFDLLLLGDLDGTLRPPFPAAVRSALSNDAGPILRLQRRALETVKLLERIPPRLLSVATNVATTCEETLLPWARTTPIADRRRQAAVFAARLPDALFGPFDRLTALDSELLLACERWPAAPAAPSVASGPAPNVPVLLLEGEDDLRTPVEGARRVAERFPAARMLVVQEAGHVAILADDEESCALRGLERFFTARRVRRACPRDDFRLDEPSPVAPLSLRELRPVRGVRGRRRGQALRALQLTVFYAGGEAFRESLANILSDVVRAGGLRAGSLRYHSLKERISLKGYSLVPGVSVSGVLRRFDSTRRVHGRLRIAGPGTPDGKLRVQGRRLSGRLGGRRVRARLSLDQISGLVAAGAAQRKRTPKWKGAVIGVP